jgi:isopenicillin N synthase-like dioxygenase
MQWATLFPISSFYGNEVIELTSQTTAALMNQSLNFSDIQKSLQRDYYVNVPFPIKPDEIEAAVQAFFRFLEEPEEVKQHIDFTIAPLHRRGDVGYKHRDPSDHIYNDSKEFFHFHPALFERYPDFLKAHPVVANFVNRAKPIWEAAHQTVSDILSAFEPSFPGIHARIFDTDMVHVQLRFLRYDWQQSGELLAKPHFDAGSFTLAIAESCPGLRIGSCPENLQPVDHKPGNAMFMLSSNYRKVIDSDDYAPGWHDVIQMDKTCIGKPFARWAVVAFIEAHGVEALSRSETHKWYKEKVA